MDGLSPPTVKIRAPVPEAAPLNMPDQDLRAAPVAHRTPPAPRVLAARTLAYIGAAALTAFGAWQMTLAVSVQRMNGLQAILLGLFVLTFAWIAFSATSAVAGLLFGPRRPPGGNDRPLPKKTALIMPVYQEDPAGTAAALQAMGEGVADLGHGEAFDIFILSDTRDADTWVKETAVFQVLRTALAGRMAVWYRRRWQNVARKAGNIRDFVENWGGRYEVMIVLDADSLMAPEILVEMARRMAAEPRLGILQSVPRLAGGSSLFARLQQFAGRIYGPIVASGVAAWQGEDGNYWGHNAAIRVAAFAAACGLPDLPGRKPFGGHILSHDFVEAALMRRAGWQVRMDPDLDGSWENGPPALLDVAVRDRRWAQGNLQHAKVIGARGLAWPNRAHFAIGIGSYLASPLWLGMILVGLAITVQAALTRPEYFLVDFQLYPAWPRFDAERMRWLFVLAMGVLLIPKVFGVLRGLVDSRLRRGCGGALAMVSSALVETALSALYAPVMMMMQTRQIWEILIGFDSGWSPQRRDAQATPWTGVIRRHSFHMVEGMAVAVAVWLLSPELLMWMSPPLLGLMLAIPLSRFSGSVSIGRMLRVCRLLLIPEETAPPAVAQARDALLPDLRRVSEGASIERMIADADARLRHFAATLPPPPPARGRPDADRLTIRSKIAEGAGADEVMTWLTPGERVALVADRTLFELMVDSHKALAEPARNLRALP